MLLIELTSQNKKNLAEVAMNPTAYAQSMAQAPEKMLIGFEFEVCAPEKLLKTWKRSPEEELKEKKKLWKEIKSFLEEGYLSNSYRDLSYDEFDKMFKLNPGKMLHVPKNGSFSNMQDAAEALSRPHLYSYYWNRIEKILKYNKMWKFDDFNSAFTFNIDAVRAWISYGDEDLNYLPTASILASAVSKYLSKGKKPKVFSEYHEKDKNLVDWYIEPDGSLEGDQPNDGTAEIVSPPMPLASALEALRGMYTMSSDLGLYTNETTGLHINMSIPKNIDILKLIVFVGDTYLLKQFNRENSEYASNLYKSLEKSSTIETAVKKFMNHQISSEEKISVIQHAAQISSYEHQISISNNGNYISFRHAGGDYLNDYNKIVNTVGRFARVMMIASDPDAYREEYFKKIFKIAEHARDKILKQKDIENNDVRIFRKIITELKTKGVPVIQFDSVHGVRENNGHDYFIERMLSYPLKINPADCEVFQVRVASSAVIANVTKDQLPREIPLWIKKGEGRGSRSLIVPRTWKMLPLLLNLELNRQPLENFDAMWDHTRTEIQRLPVTDRKVKNLIKNIRDYISQLRAK